MFDYDPTNQSLSRTALLVLSGLAVWAASLAAIASMG